MADLNDSQMMRYRRHLLLPEIGVEGQKKIMNSKVLVIGTGGLGSPVDYYLTAAGVGTIGIVDYDVVDLSNLQRQILHFTSDLNKPKVFSAKNKLNDLNPDVNVVVYNQKINDSNACDIIKDYDFIVDCTDNFFVKYLINDSCVRLEKPFSHAGIFHFYGQTFTHLPGTACYRCLFPEFPTDEYISQYSNAGLFGAIAGMLGSIQAAEVLKYITGVGELLTNRLLTFDALTMSFNTVNFKPLASCPICGQH